MTKKELYRHLVALAEKNGVRVLEQNLGATGVNAKSGLCRVKGDDVFIMDKRLQVSEKATILGKVLAGMLGDDTYVMPAVRSFLESLEGEQAKP